MTLEGARLARRTLGRDGAIAWLLPIAQAGNDVAAGELALLYREAGELEPALEWYGRQTNFGGSATREVAKMLAQAEQAGATAAVGIIMSWLTSRAELGDRNAAEQLGEFHCEAGNYDEAVTWLWAAGPSAARGAAKRLEQAGRIDEALALFERATASGTFLAAREAWRMLRDAGRAEEGWSWLITRVERGDAHAAVVLAGERWDAHDVEESLGWFRRAAVLGDSSVVPRAAGLLASIGRSDRALQWLRDLAEDGVDRAVDEVASILAATRGPDSAYEWWYAQADQGVAAARERAVEVLRTGGQRARRAAPPLRLGPRRLHLPALARAASTCTGARHDREPRICLASC